MLRKLKTVAAVHAVHERQDLRSCVPPFSIAKTRNRMAGMTVFDVDSFVPKEGMLNRRVHGSNANEMSIACK